MACLIPMIINIYRLYYFYCYDMDGAFDVLMGYEYSFLVDLDILSPLVQLVFSFRRAQDRYGSLGFLAANLPGKNGNKAQ